MVVLKMSITVSQHSAPLASDAGAASLMVVMEGSQNQNGLPLEGLEEFAHFFSSDEKRLDMLIFCPIWPITGLRNS